MLEPQVLEQRSNTRTLVVRRAGLLTPAAIGLLALLAWAAAALPQSIFGVIVVALGAIPTTLEAIAAWRDLRATPITTQGQINRLWKKSRFLVVGRVDYALIRQRLFELNTVTAMELREGDEVIIEHWPHTNIVISVTRLPRTANPPA